MRILAMGAGLLLCLSSAHGEEVRENFCLRQSLALRSQSESCWAGYRVREGDHVSSTPSEAEARLCIPRGLWLSRLRSRQPLQLCGEWQGKWRSFSPPLNPPDQFRGRSEKQVDLRFVASRLPDGAGLLPSLRSRLELWRETVSEGFRDIDRLGILRRLVLDEKVDAELESKFRFLGFVHLLSASGVHILGWVALVDFLGLSLLRGDWLPFELARIFSRVLSALGGLMAWALSGFRLGLLRPFFILGLRWVFRSRGFRTASWLPVLLGLGLDAALSFALWGSWRGWRSGVAISCGVLGIEAVKNAGARRWLWGFYFSVAAWALYGLFEAISTGWVSVAHPVFTVLTLVPVAALFYPAALLFVLGLLPKVWIATLSLGLDLGIATLGHTAIALDGIWRARIGGIMLASGLAAASLRFRRRSGAMLILGCALVVGFRLVQPIAEKTPLLLQLDVGQGDAALARLPAGWGRPPVEFMIDTGSESALSSRAWLDLFSEARVEHLDWVALTHLDEDHAGGVRRIAALIPIGEVLVSRELLASPKGLELGSFLSSRGVALRTYEASRFPFPNREFASSGPGAQTGNAVMRGFFLPLPGGGGYMNLGDSDESQEESAIRWARGVMSAVRARDPAHPPPVVLKLSHHGSRYSSSPLWLRAVHPSEVWISAGRGNPHGHPSIQALEKLKAAHVPVVRRTDLEGAIAMDLGSRGSGD